jgi:hypothetical protein
MQSVGVWVLAVVLLILFAPVGVQRLRARMWRADRNTVPGAHAPRHFPEVWFQVTPPRRASADRVTGALTIDPAARTAVLTLQEGPLPITEITDVSIGGRGSDFIATWVEVHCRVGVKPTVAYFNDGRWLAWAPVITGSNLRMADAFAALVPPPP